MSREPPGIKMREALLPNDSLIVDQHRPQRSLEACLDIDIDLPTSAPRTYLATARGRPRGIGQCPFGLPVPGLGPAPSGGLTTNSRRTGLAPPYT